MAEWYTRNVEVVVEATPWRFKSSRPHQRKDFMKKTLLFLFLSMLFFKNLYSDRFMMNCISPDNKKLAFYKLDNTNEKKLLFTRSIKGRWINFCIDDDDINKKVTCVFDKLKIIRIEEINKEYELMKVENILNFDEYKLKEKIRLFDKIEKTKLKNENQTNYKCRKKRI